MNDQIQCTYQQLVVFCLLLSGVVVLFMVLGMAAAHYVFKWLQR